MEKNKSKSKESIIGKIIYGFLMFTPLLAIGVTCLYGILNKNANKSYSGTLKQETTNYLANNTNNEVYTGNNILYYANGKETSYKQSYSGWFYFDEISIESLQNTNFDRFRYRFQNQDWQFYNPISNQYEALQNQEFTFTLKEYRASDTGTQYLTNVYYITYVAQGTLENIFYQSINNVENSNLFNWAENNTLYSGVKATTDLFSINNTFVPMLLTYWLIMSLIYILYDIVLMIFNVIHRKLHEIQESI